ncbi:hypothetical protein AC249_AIPGENE12182 [Exaiptasia diaphana]|nr:hypothetical protein AC249_AIPGENE12182 [Exaiptasia diaphana]
MIKNKFKQIHSEEIPHLDENGTTPNLNKETETKSRQNPIQESDEHTKEEEDIEKQVTVLEEVLHVETKVPPKPEPMPGGFALKCTEGIVTKTIPCQLNDSD